MTKPTVPITTAVRLAKMTKKLADKLPKGKEKPQEDENAVDPTE